MAYPAYGFDYTGGLSAATISRARVDGHPIAFVCRYLSGFSKDLTPSEAHNLSSAGISIVVVWETTATRAEGGHAAGVRDATMADAEARRCGMPASRPIYFAVDEDTTVGPHITAYFEGVASVLGRARTGAYGGYKVISALFDAHLIAWGWQTYAWSGGQWDTKHPGTVIEQYSNNRTLAGASVDYDRATATDYGQWRIGVTPTPTPTPTPQEEDMLSGKFTPGKGEKDPIVFKPGAFTKLRVGSDNTRENTALGITRQGPAHFRLAYHVPGRKGTTDEDIAVGAALNDTEGRPDAVERPLPAGCDYIAVERLDDGTRPVGFSVY